MKSKKASIALIIVIIASVLIVGTITVLVIANAGKESAKAECSVDSDCIKVLTTCCGCEMGGNEICVPHGQEEIYRAKNCPKDPLCMAVYNCQIEKCTCFQGKCNAVITEKIQINE